ncbi:MAG: hypothetical protein QXK37_06195, partial [Candidatus Woesearchaeota archaeon]
GIQAVIPMRNYGAKKIYRGKSFRKKSQKHFTLRTYHRREIVETVLSAIKRKFGASVSSVKLKAQKTEMYCRAIAHNISASLYDFLNGALVLPKSLYMSCDYEMLKLFYNYQIKNLNYYKSEVLEWRGNIYLLAYYI